ncbi:TasA family protein [Thermococcus prieurii]
MKRSLLVVSLLCLLLAAGVSRSLFTDSALSKGNRITSGELSVTISRDGKRFYHSLKLFELKNLVPGDVRRVSFYVKNGGTVAIGRLTLTLTVRDYEVKMSNAEKDVDSTPKVGELGKWLVLKTISVNGKSVLVNKTLDDLNGKTLTLPVKLKPGEKARVEMNLELPKKAGNECQTDGIDVTLRLDASQ